MAIVAPAHNESDALPGFLSDLEDLSKGTSYNIHLYLVDDRSTDGTSFLVTDFAHALSQRTPNFHIHIIPVVQWRGKANAQATGLYSILGNFDVILLMDSDGQHNPKQIPEFVEMVENTSKIVFGKRDETYRRRFISSAGTKALDSIRASLGLEATSELGEYLAFPGSMLPAVLSHPGLGIFPIVHILLALGFSATTLTVRIRPRLGDKRRTNFGFQALFTKGIHELLGEPWAYLPRLVVAVVVFASIAMIYGIGIGVQSVLDGNRNGVASIIVLQVVFLLLSSGISILTLGTLVLYIQSEQRRRTRLSQGSSKSQDE